MELDQLCQGLKKLLIDNNYSAQTIKFYEREWSRIKSFLIEEYDSTDFDMLRGLKYLEIHYGIISKYEGNTMPQQRIQLIRVIHMLEDFQLHGVLTMRYLAAKNPIVLHGYFYSTFNVYLSHLNSTDLSISTKKHYMSITKIFLDYLYQKDLPGISQIDLSICGEFIKIFSDKSFKTIEQHICGLRHFLRFIYENNMISENVANKIHMPNISKSAKIPSVWTEEELRLLLSKIDRNSPVGKRDYAMILLACILGLRSGDIKTLTFSNFHWESKQLSFIQHKTHKPLTLPLVDSLGWAVIDYIQNGRPKYYETDIIFIKHMPPFCPFPDESHLFDIIHRYMNKAGIRLTKNQHRGFHSLRHSLASMLLESNTPLPVISTILGHSNLDSTSIYLKNDLNKLKECVLNMDFEDDCKFDL